MSYQQILEVINKIYTGKKECDTMEKGIPELLKGIEELCDQVIEAEQIDWREVFSLLNPLSYEEIELMNKNDLKREAK